MMLRLILSVLFISIADVMNAQINENPPIIALPFDENGLFPNNSELPVLLYKGVFNSENADLAPEIEKVLSGNNWGGQWRNGIYSYHHYHSTAHEALGVYAGWAEVQLGGPENEPVKIEKGDLVVLPAGTAHKLMDSGGGFAVVGAYPDGRNYDMNYGKNEEFEKAKQNIAKVPLPENDPVFGGRGQLFEYWNR
jgi:uncharacterized protein YjlB